MLLFTEPTTESPASFSQNIPPYYHQFLLPHLSNSFLDCPFGAYLKQEFNGNGYSVNNTHLFVTKSSGICLSSSTDTYTLLYALQISGYFHPADTNGLEVQENGCIFLYTPAGKRHLFRMHGGHYWFFQVNISPSLFNTLSPDLPEIDALGATLRNKSPSVSCGLEAPLSLPALAVLHPVMYQDSNAHQSKQFMHEKIAALLSHFVKARGRPVAARRNLPLCDLAGKLLEAKRLIDENEGARLKLTQIARKVCLNNQLLKKCFLEMFGTTVNRYQSKRRMERAVHLLIHTNYSVHHIAIFIGYEDESSFARMFKPLHGMTPREFRNRKRFPESVSNEL